MSGAILILFLNALREVFDAQFFPDQSLILTSSQFKFDFELGIFLSENTSVSIIRWAAELMRIRT
jgi:hypothetical protein